ncbi:S-layer homology domain-containing protein [Anaerobacillus isosaccharinicus]|uniref:S-layer homology domain-containing protein n=1 Tax=Anaerobacillus isosaccharinicus TaxID=1532552 RepID=A0A1S2LZS6_9BACI|nr:S-layer homology domain-containing protein [Anaerobacillus isosaccharinicus]MBA5584460.1 S-layer homology domain-containing protein [Anaerobacillus isosaccharinicus]QOY37153.1 S-layer homology domain-containing protein [Anaerobacillus isosaccharinicus]
MKKVLVIFALLIYFMPIMVTHANGDKSNPFYFQAESLHTLGLFKGTNFGFELDRKPNRLEGAVMLVRLLGKEQQALAANYSHPFKDVPNWASPYVGYMYVNKLTSGVNSTTYGAQQHITGAQYGTFLLRALGYEDAKGDFVWSQSVNKLAEVGVIHPLEREVFATTNFLRGHVAALSNQALDVNLKESSNSLLHTLVADGAVSKAAAEKAKQLTSLEANLKLETIMKSHQINKVELLSIFHQGASPQYALELAVGMKESREIFEIAIAKGANINPELYTAITMNDLQLVKLLLDLGANPNYQHPNFDFSPLQLASNGGITSFLLTKQGTRQTYKAERSELIRKLLLQYGAVAKSQDLSGALASWNPSLLEEFLQLGADPNGLVPKTVILNGTSISLIPNRQATSTQPVILQAIDQASWNPSPEALKNVELLIAYGATLEAASQSQLDRILYLAKALDYPTLEAAFVAAGANY